MRSTLASRPPYCRGKPSPSQPPRASSFSQRARTSKPSSLAAAPAPAERGELADEVLGQPRADLVAERHVVRREAELAELVAQRFAWMARATPAHRSAASGDAVHDWWLRYERMRSATPS